jgi:hypothetical protein
VEIEPPERGRRDRVRLELAALDRVVVRVEREPTRVSSPHQHHARVRFARAIHGRQCHRVRLGDAGVEGVTMPALPLRHRIGGHVGDVDPRGFVLHPPIADLVGAHAIVAMPRM